MYGKQVAHQEIGPPPPPLGGEKVERRKLNHENTKRIRRARRGSPEAMRLTAHDFGVCIEKKLGGTLLSNTSVWVKGYVFWAKKVSTRLVSLTKSLPI